MYEPIRTKSVHTMNATAAGVPHRTREEELDIRLAGHLTALLTVTDELRARAPHPALDEAAERIAEQVARLRGGRSPLRAAPTDDGERARVPALHQRARALAGSALTVATTRADAAAVELTRERLTAHTAELNLAAV